MFSQEFLCMFYSGSLSEEGPAWDMGGGGTSEFLFIKEGSPSSPGWPGICSKSWSSASLELGLQDEHAAHSQELLSFGIILRFSKGRANKHPGGFIFLLPTLQWMCYNIASIFVFSGRLSGIPMPNSLCSLWCYQVYVLNEILFYLSWNGRKRLIVNCFIED